MPEEPQNFAVKDTPPVVEKNTQQEPQITDSIPTDTTSDSADTVMEEQIMDSFEKENEGPVFYLVGGSFSVKENADKYFNRIKKLGYQPVHLGKQGNLYVVAVEKYYSLADAENAQREFLAREPKSGVWIMPVEK